MASVSTHSPYFLPLPPRRKYSQLLKIRPFIQNRGRIHCCSESAIRGTEHGTKVQCTSQASLENSPQVSNGVTTGPRPQRQNIFKGVERCRLRCLWGREVPGAYKGPKQQGQAAGTHKVSQSHCSSFSEQSGLWANLIMERRQGKLADWILAQTFIQLYPQVG